VEGVVVVVAADDNDDGDGNTEWTISFSGNLLKLKPNMVHCQNMKLYVKQRFVGWIYNIGTCGDGIMYPGAFVGK
jgi:hypothetical protein